MKKIFFCLIVLFNTVASFAGITYELNGGITNNFDWQTPQNMYATLNADWNAFSGTTTTWKSLEELNGDITAGIPNQAAAIDISFLADANFKLHFDWLVTYMDAQCLEAGLTLASTSGVALRYNLAAFFGNAHYTGVFSTPDYTNKGVAHYSAYATTWKSAFANPYESTKEFVLNAPYKEGATFYGWYAFYDFSGNKITTIDASTTGTLYAKWKANILTIAEVSTLPDNTETSVSGVVSMVQGSEFWMEDATGGLMCWAEDHGLIEGDSVILNGTKVIYGGIPELKNITVEHQETSRRIIPPLVSIADIVADTTQYISTLVKLEGVNVNYEVDNYLKVYLSDYTNCILAYKLSLDTNRYPEGTQVDAIVIVSGWNGILQFRTTSSYISNPFEDINGLAFTPLGGDSVAVKAHYSTTYAGEIVIPETIVVSGKTYRVTGIVPSAFYGCSNLTAITIGNNVTNIGNNAFKNCTSLQQVQIGKNVATIGNYAFYGCTQLASINIHTSVTNIGTYVFDGCNNLVYNVYENVSYLGNPKNKYQALIKGNDTYITSCTMHDKTVVVAGSAFAKNTYLQEIIVPEGVISVGNQAFLGCTKLPSITLPKSLNYIGNSTFKGCTSFTTVTIPENVISIDEWAFHECDNLETVNIKPTTPPALGNAAFHSEILFYVPCGSLDTYEMSETNWGNYLYYEEGLPLDIIANSTDETMGTAAVTQAPTCEDSIAIIKAVANEGYQFVAWNDGNTENPRAIKLTEDTTFTATFFSPTSVTGVSLNETSIALAIDATEQLVATVDPENAGNKNLSWLSTDEAVATVENGVVTAVGSGSAAILVRTEEGDFLAWCNVTVAGDVSGISLDKTSLELLVGNTEQLIETVTAAEAAYKAINWATSDANVATVENGLVTAVGAGVAAIGVATADGGFVATCAVVVTESGTTEVQQVAANPSGVQKVLVDGVLYIVQPNGEKYTIDGRKVE